VSQSARLNENKYGKLLTKVGQGIVNIFLSNRARTAFNAMKRALMTLSGLLDPIICKRKTYIRLSPLRRCK
jgi:hypothetical protein